MVKTTGKQCIYLRALGNTEVKNNSNKTLQITWFDAYIKYRFKWYPSNIKGRKLTSEDFKNWYGSDIILPKSSVTCDVNWHGKNKPYISTVIWAYLALDDQGNEYYNESKIKSRIIINKKSLLWFTKQIFIYITAIILIYIYYATP